MRPCAKWVATEQLNHAAFLSRRNRSAHPLAGNRYFSKYLIRIDTMHVMDNNGITGAICGGILYHAMTTKNILGTTIEARLAEINRRLRRYQSTYIVSSRFPKILQSTLKPSAHSWVSLYGRAVKATNTRHLAPFVQMVACDLYQSDSAWDTNIRSVICNLCKVYDVMYSGGFGLSDRELLLLNEGVDGLGLSMMKLRA